MLRIPVRVRRVIDEIRVNFLSHSSPNPNSNKPKLVVTKNDTSLRCQLNIENEPWMSRMMNYLFT